MEYILIQNYDFTGGVEWEGKTLRNNAMYDFCEDKDHVYDGYYPPKIGAYIDQYLGFAPDVDAPIEGTWIIENQSTFDIFYNALQADPDIQVDFDVEIRNCKYE